MIFLKFIKAIFFLMPSLINAQLCTSCMYQSPGNTVATGVLPTAIAFSPSGCFAVANSPATGGFVTIYTVASDCIATPGPTINLASGATPSALAFSPNGCLAVADTTNMTVTLYSVSPDCTTVTPTGSITTGITSPLRLAFSPNGCLAVSNLNAPSNVTLYSVAPDCTTTGTVIGATIPSNAQALAFSANGCLAVSGPSSLTVDLYSVDSGCNHTLQQSLSVNQPSSIAFSPNGSCLAVTNGAGTTQLALYAIDSSCHATQVGLAIAESIPRTVAFSQDGACLAVAADVGPASNFILIYSMGSNCAINNPSAPVQINTMSSNVPKALAFSPNGCLGVSNTNTSLGPPFNGTVQLFTHSTILAPIISGVFPTCLSTVTVVGTGQATDTIALLIDGGQVATTMASASGTFIFSNIPVAKGTHCFVALDTLAGCSSSPVCATAITSCVLPVPNLAFGTQC